MEGAARPSALPWVAADRRALLSGGSWLVQMREGEGRG